MQTPRFRVISVLIIGMAVLAAAASPVQETNGVVVVEAESAAPGGAWSVRTSISGYRGAGYVYNTASTTTGGSDTLTYPFVIANAGRYQFQMRSRIAKGTSNHVANDIFVRVVAADGSIVSPVANDNGTNDNTWYKAHMNRLNSWHWDTRNHDNTGRSLSWRLESGRQYQLQISRRSDGHAVDRMVLWNHAMGNFADKATGQTTSSHMSALNALSNSPAASNVPTLVDEDVIALPAGRIAITFDGNDNDPDDIGALPMVAALLWAAGATDRLVHLDHSNHLGGNIASQYTKMQESATGSINRFGLDPARVFDAQQQLSALIANFKAEAERSTDADPLWFICAGPMETAYRCVAAVAQSKRKHLRLISHADWNEEYLHAPQMTHDWADLKAAFPEVHFIDLVNQNFSNGDRDWNTPRNQWYWLRDSSHEPYRWVFSRDPFSNKFDPSDAGMVYWLLSGGTTRGNQHAGWPEARALLEGALTTPPNPEEPPVEPPTQQVPFLGTPIAIPGTLQLEHYDLGGAGVAWHDSDTGNQGAVFRNDGVDLQATTDAGGGYHLAWTAAGEWLEYTVSVAAAGNYQVIARASSRVSGGNFRLVLNGAAIGGTIAVPVTGDWQTFTDVDGGLVTLPAGTHVLRVAIDSSGFNLNHLRFEAVTSSATMIAEAGSVTVAQESASQWHVVTLQQSYVDPVVIVGPATQNGNEPVTVRVRHVSATAFEFQIKEWDYLDGAHIAESISYLVAERGVHRLEDGRLLEAGITTNVGTTEKTISFTGGFATTPVLVSQVVGVQDPTAVVTRQRAITVSGATIKLQGAEATPNHGAETVGWIAIEPALGADVEAARTGDVVTDAWHAFSFGRSGTNTAFLAAMQTADGIDPSGLRVQNRNASGAQVRVEEETSADAETTHATENVGWILLPEGPMPAVQIPVGSG